MNRHERGAELEQHVEEAVADLEYQMSQGFTENFLKVLHFYSNFHHYSVMNAFLIKMQRPNARLCAGMKQWNKLGHRIRKGEDALWIRAPWMRKELDRDTGEIVERVIGYLAVPVWDVTQLEGDVELPTWREQLSGDYEQWYLLAMMAMEGTGIVVLEDSLPWGVHGTSTGGTIYINKDDETPQKFNTLLHELAHELMHYGEDRPESRRQRELEAESCAFVLSRIYGLENPYSKDYILAYKGTVEDLRSSLSRIHTAVKQAVMMLGIEPKHQALEESQAA